MTTSVDTIVELLKETGHAHHQAFAATDGVDPEWPLWYAKFLQPKFTELFGRDFTRSEIVALLVNLDQDQKTRGADEPWVQFYAHDLRDRFVPSPEEKLALYHFATCPYCRRVRKVIDELGVEVELRDIWENPQYRNELMVARGRTTVPVLQCTDTEGRVRWMPESSDIIAHLRERFGTKAA